MSEEKRLAASISARLDKIEQDLILIKDDLGIPTPKTVKMTSIAEIIQKGNHKMRILWITLLGESLIRKRRKIISAKQSFATLLREKKIEDDEWKTLGKLFEATVDTQPF